MYRFLISLIVALAAITPTTFAAEEATSPEAEIAAAVNAPVDSGTMAPVPADGAPPAEQSEDANILADVGAAIAGEGDSTWRTILGTVIVILGGMLTKWLRKSALSKAKSYEEQAKNAGQDTKQRIVARAKAYIWRRAAEIQEYELPELAAAVVRRQISADQLKRRLRALGDRLVDETVEYFDRQDIDIVAEFGKAQIMSWIRSAVDEISVFQKWPTAKILVEGGAEAILAVGMDTAGDYYDALREKVISGTAGGSGAAASGTVEGMITAKIDKAVKDEFTPAPAGA